MAKKIIVDEKGTRYQQMEEEKDYGDILALLVLGAVIAFIFSPGMVITSLFAGVIESSFWAWVWSILFSVGIFCGIFFSYRANKKIYDNETEWIWSLGTYAVIAGLSFWLLCASEGENIVRICKLLKLEDV